jgi:hypothetical protein
MTAQRAEPTTDASESITPESLREQAADLPLTASHAALLPELLAGRKSISTNGIPDSEPPAVKEVWPAFECRACGADLGEVAYEPSPNFADGVDEYHDTIQFVWEGRRPVCNRCGSGLTARTIERYRPPRWQQPIIGILRGIPRLSETHGPLMETFECDPVAFVRAEMDELRTIEGIGETFARKIVVKKHGSFGDRAPRPGADWPELHAEAKREARFA